MARIPKTSPVLITGCSSGIGRASAIAFARRGFLTVATSRNLADIEDLRAEGCEIRALDVTDDGSAETVAAIEKRFGPVGVLVNNAGFPQYGPIEEVPLDGVRRSFETNVLGVVRMAQLVLPGMREVGRGRIVNVSSVAGRVSMPGAGIYHASKFALEAISDALRVEVKDFGIDVANVLPGPVATKFVGKVAAGLPDTGPDSPYRGFKDSVRLMMERALRPGNPGVLSPEDIAAAILSAATDRVPRIRYNVGSFSKLAPMLHAIAPERVVDAAFLRVLGRR
ncbi:Short-chain dehydrogenase [Faunimonas pinastri]|uniref:Short-chain dehydrogenase n=1 Tax=Faunimonas pinastri TaxID=1855383 RepID=A0A1H8Z554_9HYPH|nr:SDR family oxidoreductase [Faunimonas pinastri]SEP59609.1 Short-chain dehydrogenase [Faunimonas pinastri]